MSRRVRLGSAAAIAGALIAILSSLDVADAQPRSARGAAVEEPRRLYVVVHTRHDRGRVFCALWRGREGYPTEHERAVGRALDRTIEGHEAVCLFEDVSPGEYAAAIFHDENGNNDLDTNVFGIPSEGTGASNDASNPFGPPSYDDARFRYPATTRMHRIDVRIRY